jgi:hypothetical protein
MRITDDSLLERVRPFVILVLYKARDIRESEHSFVLYHPVLFGHIPSADIPAADITTMDSYSGSFLLEHQALWDKFIPYTSIHQDLTWTKLIVHDSI